LITHEFSNFSLRLIMKLMDVDGIVGFFKKNVPQISDVLEGR
jgi:hypothetical protein